MELMIALYQEDLQKRTEEEIEAELLDGKKNGAAEVFTSLHLPETSLESQIRDFKRIGGLVKRAGLRLCADIGGAAARNLSLESALLEAVKKQDIYSIRLDYGYETEDIKKLTQELGITRFVLNASILSEKETDLTVKKIREICPGAELSACHNFYPRKESGLTYDFCRRQYKFFAKHNIPVTVCVSSLTNPRGPLHEGLPTIEAQRYYPMERKILELFHGDCCESIMIGDSFSSSEEKAACSRILEENSVDLRIRTVKEISDTERKILFGGAHRFRYDSGEYAWRSQTSREMSEAGRAVQPNVVMKRFPYMVTIDNKIYQRYSGEVQIMKREAPLDEGVNFAGMVVQADIWKLQYLDRGSLFHFVEEKEGI